MADYTEYHGEAIKRFFKPPTNADRIRAMSDEALAGVVCTGCPPGRETDDGCTLINGVCYDCWLNWLRSPSEGGDGDAVP